MSGLYDEDILLWSERQGDLLRRVAAGEPVNERPDWDNIIEEVESVGRSDLRAVRSLLLQALLHILKAQAWPDSTSAAVWEADARLFRIQARDAFSPSMRQRLDVPDIYADALEALPASMDGQPPRLVAESCSMTLDELLAAKPKP
ncbi:MAG TPA: DUF29 family protein [Acetobacteraceae bacterium]|nr:DUF29 family protein [Acetobacteraceae bacterium]